MVKTQKYGRVLANLKLRLFCELTVRDREKVNKKIW